MIWRLIEDSKSDIVFSACFDYDMSIYLSIPHAQICRKFITKAHHVHNIVSD
jgi:hypothetical protein